MAGTEFASYYFTNSCNAHTDSNGECYLAVLILCHSKSKLCKSDEALELTIQSLKVLDVSFLNRGMCSVEGTNVDHTNIMEHIDRLWYAPIRHY